MMRKSLLTLVLMAVVGFISAQNLSFVCNGEVVEDGATIVCNDFASGFEFQQEFQIKNNTDADINVMFGKEEISVPGETLVYFCCGQCYGPDVMITPIPYAVPAQSLTGDGMVSVHYMNNEVPGSATARFFMYDERNPEEVVSVYVIFNSGDGVNENSNGYSFSSAYPNPASSEVRFDVNCNGNASIAVYNLLGQEVLSQHVDNGQVVISVADLNEGIYFCNLKVNGCVVKTEKFIVKK